MQQDGHAHKRPFLDFIFVYRFVLLAASLELSPLGALALSALHASAASDQQCTEIDCRKEMPYRVWGPASVCFMTDEVSTRCVLAHLISQEAV